MKKILLVWIVFFMMPLQVLACGGFEGFAPKGRSFETRNDTNVLIWFRDNTETYIVEPSFEGNASTFGIIIPFPSRPQIDEAPENLFAELESLTSAPVARLGVGTNGGMMGGPSMKSQVTVHERKNVGDFHTTVLSATDPQALIKWLGDNNFNYSDKDTSNFQYYIDKGGFYFAALKINVETAHIDYNGTVSDRLRPLAFTFQTNQPTIAMRIAASEEMPMDFILYTLADTMYFVPGASVVYSNKITKDTLSTVPSLLKYDGVNQWLTKAIVTMDPRAIETDLIIHRALESAVVSNEYNALVPNVDHIPVSTGIVKGIIGDTTTIPVDTNGNAPMIGEKYLLQLRILLGTIGTLCLIVLYFLIRFMRNRKKPHYTPLKGTTWSLISKKTLLTAFTSSLLIPVSFLLALSMNELFNPIFTWIAITIALWIPIYIFVAKKSKWTAIFKVLFWQIIFVWLFIFSIRAISLGRIYFDITYWRYILTL